MVLHPSFTGGWSLNVENIGVHDIAVLFLAEAVPVKPMAIAAAPTAPALTRYVGYGQSATGQPDFGASAGQRKSAVQEIVEVTNAKVVTRGVGGGLCWGDSGGPLLEERGTEIYGVLSGFNREPFSCQVGDEMAFTSTDGERAFLTKALACVDAVDPSACMVAPDPPPPESVWSVSSTAPFVVGDKGTSCRWRDATTTANANGAVLDIAIEHTNLATLSAWVTHAGVRYDVFGPGTLTGSLAIELSEQALPGASGPAAGRWTLCVLDDAADSHVGVVSSWSIHD
jgi:hypothetical protein